MDHFKSDTILSAEATKKLEYAFFETYSPDFSYFDCLTGYTYQCNLFETKQE